MLLTGREVQIRRYSPKYVDKFPVLGLYLVNLPLLSTLRIVSVYQLATIFMAPGIEPGNLIRSTLIRYPPGPFLVKN